jgi:hypothetical protein
MKTKKKTKKKVSNAVTQMNKIRRTAYAIAMDKANPPYLKTQ